MKLHCVVVLIGSLAFCMGQEPENNACMTDRDSGDCFDHIRRKALDDESFWFGRSNAWCEDVETPDCFNPIGEWGFSLASLIFGEARASTALNGLDRYLNMEYENEEFRYQGCGTEVRVPASRFDNDMSLAPQLPATLFDAPKLRWRSDPGEMFTMAFVDPGFSYLHQLVINIEGDDLMTGDTISAYTPPRNFRFTPNPYVVLLFKQNREITWDDNWNTAIREGSFVVRLAEFVEFAGLQGPIAMNILMVTTDISAVSYLESTAGDAIQYCSIFVEEALNEKEELFLPRDLELSSFFKVSVITERSETFEYCCEEHVFPPTTTRLNPLSERPVRAANVRDGSQLRFSVNATGIPPMLEEDLMFTVVMVDADVRGLPFADAERPMLHYLAYNLRVESMNGYSGMLSGGEVEMPYLGPAPPDAEPHTCYFLLFKQSAELDDLRLDEFRTNVVLAPQMLEGRTYFEVGNFAEGNDLELFGASWMHVGNDEFVNFLWELDQEDYCGDNAPPCRPPTTTQAPLPPSSASGLQVALTSLVFAVMAAILF